MNDSAKLFGTLLIVALVFSASCSRQIPQRDSGQHEHSKEIALDEVIADAMGDPTGALRKEVRATAAKWFTNSTRDCDLKGVSTVVLSGSMFVVALDASCGASRHTTDVIVRRFYPPDGTPAYWGVDLLKPEIANALSASLRFEGRRHEIAD